MSQGDLARTLSRVLDAVRQFGTLPYVPVRRADLMESSIIRECPGLNPEIRSLCRDAAAAINRYPLKDPLSFEAAVDEEDTEEDEADEDEMDEEDPTEEVTPE